MGLFCLLALGKCSKSCGGGARRRSAVCKSPDNDEGKCNARDRLVVLPCNEFQCPQWRAGEWSEVQTFNPE